MKAAEIVIIVGLGLVVMYGLASAFSNIMLPIAAALGGAA